MAADEAVIAPCLPYAMLKAVWSAGRQLSDFVVGQPTL
jgi:hypothetical protein